MSINTFVVTESTAKSRYNLFISKNEPNMQKGSTGALWFKCAHNDFFQVLDYRRGNKRADLSAFSGELWIQCNGTWEKRNRKPASLASDIHHPVCNGWQLNTYSMSWRSQQSIKGSQRHMPRLFLQRMQILNNIFFTGQILSSSSANRVPPTTGLMMLADSPSPAPPSLPPLSGSSLPPQASLQQPEQPENSLLSHGVLPRPLVPSSPNTWICPLLQEWSAIASLKKCNNEAGLETLYALLAYPGVLYEKGGPESLLITERHNLMCKNVPSISVILKEYSRAPKCTVTATDSGQADMSGVGLWEVVDSFMRGSNPDVTLCSILQIPDTSLARECQFELPEHIRASAGAVSHWKDEGADSPWQYSLVPGASITFPHVDTWTSSTYISHFSGKKLWLFWPGTVENFAVLYSGAFSGHDHRVNPAYAIQHMSGLETLLVDDSEHPCWVMPAGTIHCVLTFSRIAAHGGFNVHRAEWWQSSASASSNILALISNTPKSADTSAQTYLEEMKLSMNGWDSLVKEAKRRRKAVKDLEAWVSLNKKEIESVLDKRRPKDYDK